jgi:hypothetical protein
LQRGGIDLHRRLDIVWPPGQGQSRRRAVKAVALLFLTVWAVAACGLPRTNTYIYGEFGPHYGDGGGG